MSEFAMEIARFRAEHADRYAKIDSGAELSAGDEYFLYWSHMQMLTYGEAYYRQFQLGLVANEHWQGFTRWIESYIQAEGFVAFWHAESASFATDYSQWIQEKMDG